MAESSKVKTTHKVDPSYEYIQDRKNHEVYKHDNRPIVQIFAPIFRTFFTDIFTTPFDYQDDPVCGTIEMNLMKCLEAYGANRGFKVCRDFIDDYRECSSLDKQKERFRIMRTERQRQFAAGERDVKYAHPPRMGSFKSQVF